MSDEPIVVTDSSSKDPIVDNLMTDEVKNRLLEFLRFIFSNSERFKYNDDELVSKISLSDVFPKKEDYEKKPAIVVRRENLMATNRGIGHFKGWTYSKNFGSRYQDLFRSQCVIECYSKEGLEAEKLANIVFQSFLYFRNKLREVGRVHDILVANIGPEIPQRVSSEITLSMVPVQLSFEFTESWTVEEIGTHLFNGLEVSVLVKDL
jgi:hypothetical protein